VQGLWWALLNCASTAAYVLYMRKLATATASPGSTPRDLSSLSVKELKAELRGRKLSTLAVKKAELVSRLLEDAKANAGAVAPFDTAAAPRALSRFGTVYLNNASSSVVLGLVAACTGELWQAGARLAATGGGLNQYLDPATAAAGAVEGVDRGYALLNVCTSMVGFMLNFAQLW